MLCRDAINQQHVTNNKNVDINRKINNNDKYRIYEETEMITSDSLPDTLTTREAANILNASVRTIQLWVEDGRLKAWKTPGGHRRVLRASVEEMLANRRRASGDDERRYEVLLVEPDPAQLALLESTLSGLSPDTSLRASTDAYEALLRIGEARPDLLVIDLHMPGLDGIHLVNTLARLPSTKTMRVIALTNLTPDEATLLGGLPDQVMALRKPPRPAALLSMAKANYSAWSAGGR